jgi:hypothetical protein
MIGPLAIEDRSTPAGRADAADGEVQVDAGAALARPLHDEMIAGGGGINGGLQ